MDFLPGLVWSSDASGRLTYVNRACQNLGVALDRRWAEQGLMHPDDREAFTRDWPGEAQARLRGPDQEYRWFLFRLSPKDDGGWWGLCLDIDDRKWSEDLVACEKRQLEMIGQGEALPRILETFCQLFDQLSGDTMSAILLYNRGSRTLRRAAGPNLPPAYRDGRVVDLSPGPMAGSCGTAAHTLAPVFVEDITTDPRWADYYPYQLSHGIRSSWSMPILDGEGGILGTFAIMADRPRKPTGKHVSILERFRHLARLTIERARSEEAIRRSRAYLAEAERLSHTGAFGWSRETGELSWSEETFRIFALDPTQAPTLEGVCARVHPLDRERFQQTLETLDDDCLLKARLLLPEGGTRHIELVLQACPQEFVGAVLDVSDRKEAEANLQRQTEALSHLVGAGQQALDHLAEKPDLEALLARMLGLCFDDFGACATRVRLGETSFLRLDRGDLRPRVEAPPTLWPGGEVSIPLPFRNQSEGELVLLFENERVLSGEEELLAGALANHLVLLLELRRISERARTAALLDERSRVARDMHDTLAQAFTGILMQLQAAALAESSEARPHLQRATELARSGLQEARRSVHALRPQALESQDLGSALETMLLAMTTGTSVRGEFRTEGEKCALPPEVEEALLRVGQEMLSNSLRHAEANRVCLGLTFDGPRLRLQVEDDGRGFIPGQTGDGMGLAGIRERVESVGGAFVVDSRPGEGARLSVSVSVAVEARLS